MTPARTPEERVVIELYDSEANRERILDLLGRQIPAKAGPDDQVVVFFAGHGQTESLPGDQVRGYVVPVDGDTERPFATAISMASIRDLSARIQAKHILFLMDSCYSGIGFQRGIRPVAAGPGLLQELTSRRAVQLIAAGTGGQEALEVGGRGLFTTKLLEGLAGEADANADGAVTASELGGYVTPAVSAASRDRQTPRFGTLEGMGDAVFRLRR